MMSESKLESASWIQAALSPFCPACIDFVSKLCKRRDCEQVSERQPALSQQMLLLQQLHPTPLWQCSGACLHLWLTWHATALRQSVST